MGIERKSFAASVKVIDDAQGIVEAFVSGIGNVDDGGDVIHPGAYAETLRSRNPKGIWSHDWTVPVAKTLEAEEVSQGDPRLPVKMKNAGIGGLRVLMQFNLATTRGREAFEDVKFYGEEQEWSIGYRVPSGGSEMKDGVRHIYKVDLFEYSPVLFGMNPLTATGSVKDAKIIPGSHEEQRMQLWDALEDAEQAPCGIIATFDDSVVYWVMLENADAGTWEEITRRRTWSRKEDGTYTFGDAQNVEVIEVVQPKSEEARATMRTRAQTKPDAKEAAMEDVTKALEALGLAHPLLEKHAEHLTDEQKESIAQTAAALATLAQAAEETTDEPGKTGEEQTQTSETFTLDEKALMEFEMLKVTGNLDAVG